MQSKIKEFTKDRDWTSYNKAQTKEGRLFVEILRNLLDETVSEPIKKKGRPMHNQKDVIFCLAMKLYFGMPSRTLTSQLWFLKDMGYIKKVPHHSSVTDYMRRKSLTPTLNYLLMMSAMPLKYLETRFAVDSTGFSTNSYERWFDSRVGYNDRHKFVKCHAMCGIFTNVITSLEITTGECHDSPEFDKLVSRTAENFKIDEVLGDKAYSSRHNLETVHHYGGVPYIPFRSNCGMKRKSGVWKTSLELFRKNRSKFYKHYHKRSNVEASFSALKRKFGAKLYFKNFESQVNELYLKCLVYNICILVKAIFSFDIEIDFSPRDAPDYKQAF